MTILVVLKDKGDGVHLEVVGYFVDSLPGMSAAGAAASESGGFVVRQAVVPV